MNGTRDKFERQTYYEDQSHNRNERHASTPEQTTNAPSKALGISHILLQSHFWNQQLFRVTFDQETHKTTCGRPKRSSVDADRPSNNKTSSCNASTMTRVFLGRHSWRILYRQLRFSSEARVALVVASLICRTPCGSFSSHSFGITYCSS